ncbi:Alpha/Beta hydrolase protein [Astrocystis sublimbata]|nr:Alpha/Beta hydrolase protein [Astrocystis sublimbata]
MGLFDFGRRKTAQPLQCQVDPPSSGRGYQVNQHTPNPLQHGWETRADASAPIHAHRQGQGYHHPIVVNQHYYLNPPLHPYNYPINTRSGADGSFSTSTSKLTSTPDLLQGPLNIINTFVDDGLPSWHAHGTRLINQSAALCDRLASKFDNVMTLVDLDKFMGHEDELFTYQQPSQALSSHAVPKHEFTAAQNSERTKNKEKNVPNGQNSAIIVSQITSGYFAKVDLYANSKLPLELPPLRVAISIFPLLCLAAQYAQRVYEKPQGAERDALVNADWKTGTKAMYIKSVPMDKMGVIVFAIRGTATLFDWLVNLNTAGASPVAFLDDTSNLCHAGFLSVARKMIAPVASRLRHLLEEDPGRCAHSLLITGHSAGGAIASLLYAHMLATSKTASSELNLLTGCFKRIHCVTFGSPPVSLFPLQTPPRHELRKSIFYSFINEGDPVTRADKAYVKSLLELFAAPAPTSTDSPGDSQPKPAKGQRKKPSTSTALRHLTKSSQSLQSKPLGKRNKTAPSKPIWRVPPNTLSNAGKIVVLRSGNPQAKMKRIKTVDERLSEGVVAQVVSDKKLRGVIWGDPVCHMMKLYAARIEALAVVAVTAKGH